MVLYVNLMLGSPDLRLRFNLRRVSRYLKKLCTLGLKRWIERRTRCLPQGMQAFQVNSLSEIKFSLSAHVKDNAFL